ncbi:MAG: glycosyltransferase family 2 protein [Minisyncoccia bacterium]|jgi:glycosyltransferase involved in cell wall biosynthesis
MKGIKISVIVPCRDEKEAIGECIREIKEVLAKENIDGEIIVSDSSKDGSRRIAEDMGAAVAKHDQEGYGVAIREGVENSHGEILAYADGDGTYRFAEIPNLVRALHDADIVIGSRKMGNIEKGAMPFSHRFIGTPIINALLLLFFGIKMSDSQSGFRVLRRKTFDELELKTAGMEFATEMLIKAKKRNLVIKEMPINYFRRKGASKLRPYRDGFSHVKYILIQTPISAYLAVGGILLLLGIFGLATGEGISPIFATATVRILLPIFGVQILFLGLFAKTYLMTRFNETNESLRKFYARFRLSSALTLGSLLIGVPVIMKIAGADSSLFDPMLVSTIIGLETISNSIVLSTLSIK